MAEAKSSTEPTYKVVAGDNLWNISRTLLTAHAGKEPSNAEIMNLVNEFVALNQIANRDLIYPDQILQIPKF